MNLKDRNFSYSPLSVRIVETPRTLCCSVGHRNKGFFIYPNYSIMEKIAPNTAAENRAQLKQLGFNYDKLTELLVDGTPPAELAEHFIRMYFDITYILTHPQVLDVIGISYNWNIWLQELGSVIDSLVYMNRYNLHITEEAV